MPRFEPKGALFQFPPAYAIIPFVMAAKTKTTDEARAYLLKGDDEVGKQQALDHLLAKLVAGDFIDFDLEHMEGKSTTTSERIMAGLGVPPFGSARRVVLIKYANKIDNAEQEKLATQIEKTPASGCLILVNPAAEKDDGKPKKGSEVIGDLSKAIRKIGEVKDFSGGTKPQNQARAREHAQSLFTKAGKNLDSDAMGVFLKRTGTDLSIIRTEAQKLIDYSGDEPKITARDAMAVTSETPEEKVFTLVDAIAARDQAASLRLIGELLEEGDDPRADAPKTLGTLARQFRLVWQMKALQEAGVRSFSKSSVPEEIQAMLPSEPNILDVLGRQAWMAGRLGMQARSLSRADLIRCFNAIARTDQTLKGVDSDMDDPTLAMDLLVIELAKGSR